MSTLRAVFNDTSAAAIAPGGFGPCSSFPSWPPSPARLAEGAAPAASTASMPAASHVRKGPQRVQMSTRPQEATAVPTRCCAGLCGVRWPREPRRPRYRPFASTSAAGPATSRRGPSTPRRRPEAGAAHAVPPGHRGRGPRCTERRSSPARAVIDRRRGRAERPPRRGGPADGLGEQALGCAGRALHVRTGARRV